MRRAMKPMNNKDAGKEQLDQYRKNFVARHTKLTDWETFGTVVYECLWARMDGYANPADLVHEIHSRTGIDGTGFAWHHGFSCFETLMHSEQMREVVAFRRREIRPNFMEVSYHANLNSAKYAHIRRTQPRTHIDISIAMPIEPGKPRQPPKRAEPPKPSEPSTQQVEASTKASSSSSAQPAQSGPTVEEALVALAIAEFPDYWDMLVATDNEEEEAEDDEPH